MEKKKCKNCYYFRKKLVTICKGEKYTMHNVCDYEKLLKDSYDSNTGDKKWDVIKPNLWEPKLCDYYEPKLNK
jgi:hypothetical protein